MMAHRVLIVAHHRLFGQGLLSLLAGRGTIQVVGVIDWQHDLDAAIRGCGPDTILMESNRERPGAQIAGTQHLRVIEVTLEASTICVHDSQQIKLAGGDDLIAAIDAPRPQRNAAPAAGDAEVCFL